MMNRVEMNEDMMEQVVGGENTFEELIQKAKELKEELDSKLTTVA